VAKKGKTPSREHWKNEPDAHDFPAATDYLSLLFSPDDTSSIVGALAGAATIHRKAKDLLRASGLPLLPEDDPEVAKDRKKVAGGEALSPVLLVRGIRGTGQLVVADGYHRICASYHLDEDADIPCRLADAP
jgi:hypothetical protein